MSLTNFDRWVALAIDFTGTSYVYSIDGAAVYTDSANAVDYSANWSNTQAAAVPEPGEFALLGIGLLGMVMVMAGRRAKKSA
jgi:hypothetical protein